MKYFFLIIFIINLAASTVQVTKDETEEIQIAGDSPLKEALIGLIFASISALCISAGIGGGGVFVPLINSGIFGLTAPLGAHQSAALSVTLVTFAAVAAALVNIRSGLVDYGACLVMVPAANAGTIIGVMISKSCPDWFILLLTVFVLLWVAYSAFGRFQKARRKEHRNSVNRPLLTTENNSLNKLQVQAERSSFATGAELVASWAMVWLITLILGGHRTQSVIGLEICSSTYWIVMAAAVGMLMIISFIQGTRVSSAPSEVSTPEHPHRPQSRRPSIMAYSLLSLFGGMASAVIGIGGGMIFGPLLLSLGKKPTVATATSAIAVLMTSSIAAGQLAMEGHLVGNQTLLYGMLAFLGALFGTLYITKAVERHGRQSGLILLLLVVVVTSAIFAAVVGVKKVFNDPELKGFTNPCVGRSFA